MGGCISQIDCAAGQRVRKRQPEGGLTGLGTSPLSNLFAMRSTAGFSLGTALSRAWV